MNVLAPNIHVWRPSHMRLWRWSDNEGKIQTYGNSVFSRSPKTTKLCCYRRQSAKNAREILGLDEDECNLEIIKAAFRAKVKIFHPDIYKGSQDGNIIIQQAIEAYEILTKSISPSVSTGAEIDPFDKPESKATDVFVNEFLCIGKACPSSCVSIAPHIFEYAEDTRCARANTQGAGKTEDYLVDQAASRCPRNCIHFVTPSQREVLEELLGSALLSTATFPDEVAVIQSLTARAKYVNNRLRT